MSMSTRSDRKILAVLFVLELLLFLAFYRREIAWYPPQNFDQAGLLCSAYSLEEGALAHGLGEVWSALWRPEHANGLLLPIEGALSGLLLGGTRLPQLLLNYLFFIAIQAALFYTAFAVFGRRAYGYAAVGLILCQLTPWFWAGGLFDFRMDFCAYCLFGIWTCSVMRSKIFLSRPWAICSGLAGAFLVLHRFLTITFLVGISGGLAALFLFLRFLGRSDNALTGRMSRRLFHLALCLGTIAAIVVPIFFLNRSAIYDYYVGLHAAGDQRFVRAREFGITDLVGHLLYYPHSIIADHWGNWFIVGSLALIACAILTRLLRASVGSAEKTFSSDSEAILLQFIFLAAAMFLPVAILTIDISKSPVVGGIVGVPATLMVVLLTAALTPKFLAAGSARRPELIAACSIALFGAGFLQLFAQSTRHLPIFDQRGDYQRLSAFDKWLVTYTVDRRWNSPGISCDVVSPWFETSSITASGYEQTGLFVPLRTLLPESIMGVTRSKALSLLAASDLIILTTLPKVGVYPFYESIAQYWSELKTWADENMVEERVIPFSTFVATIYARPTANLLGVSGEWITPTGLSVEAPTSTLRRFPVIRLFGAGRYSWLPRTPNVRATMTGASGSVTVPSSLRRVDDNYEIILDTSSSNLPPSETARFDLAFDSFFIPKKIGLNEDIRELVLPAPSAVQLLRKAP
jgi:hypothetical protein